jgi:hypothetical protein
MFVFWLLNTAEGFGTQLTTSILSTCNKGHLSDRGRKSPLEAIV